MQLTLLDGLVLTSVTVTYGDRGLTLADVIVDTGSASTMLAADAVQQIGIEPAPSDILYTIRGVGGVEVVFSRRVARLQVGPAEIEGFEIEVGGMDYGFAVDGILGMDFLLSAGAVIDLETLQLDFSR